LEELFLATLIPVLSAYEKNSGGQNELKVLWGKVRLTDVNLAAPKQQIILSTARLMLASPQPCHLFREHAAGKLLSQAFETHRYQSGVDDARGQIRLGDNLLYEF
jgi:hypothetical protein